MSPEPNPEAIAHYRINGKLGAGGMGEVWRATDTKLNRDVAIKVLPESFACDPDRLARFTREAQVLASLNHPNIAAIYGVEERALVMELVEGATLDERIALGPMPVEEILPILNQLVDALEYAHEKGVVHRDLKPANIKTTHEGKVKVLDFGLAKALALEMTSGDSISSPTLTMRATLAGTIMGTAAYMAPEQARGHNVDKRADIWSFGVVVYEMAAGRRLFDGPSISDTLASVLKEQPEWGRVPFQLRPLLRRCLVKDPRQRLRDIGDARALLEMALEMALEQEPAPAMPRPKRNALALVNAAAAVLMAVAAVALWAPWRGQRAAEQSLLNLDVDLGPEARLAGSNSIPFIISPDGKRLVFNSRGTDRQTRLSVRRLDQPKATELPGTDGALYPFFSPDSMWIAFFADGKLKKISVEGGTAVSLCRASSSPRGGSWGEDGTILATLAPGGGVSRVPAAGGEPAPATQLQTGEFSQRWPQILPGGKAVLVTSFKMAASMEGATVDVVTLAGRKSRTLVRDAIFGRYLPSGHLVWYSGGTLFAAPFDADRLELRGGATPLVEDVAASHIAGFAEFDFSRNGMLVYRSGAVGAGLTTIQWLDASGKTTPLLAKPGPYARPRLSPDGKRLAVTMEDAAGLNIWIYDMQRDNLSRLTRNDVAPSAAVWSPDGQYIAYQAGGQGGSGVAWTRADGSSGEPQKLSDQHAVQLPSSISPDGRRLVFLEPPPEGGSFDIWTLPLNREGSGVQPGTAEPFLQGGPVGGSRSAPVSPDGRWLAWGQRGSPVPEVYVRMFGTLPSAAGSKWQISNNGGDSPVWSRTAHELFYHSAGNIMVAPYAVKGDDFVADRPRIWTRLPAGYATGGFDLAPDGKRFVVVTPVEAAQAQIEQSHVTFLLNFFDELRKRAPAK